MTKRRDKKVKLEAEKEPTSSPKESESPAMQQADKQPLFPRLPSLSRIMSVVMLMIGILAVGALFYKVMAGFFVPLFLATLLVVIFRPVHMWIFAKVGDRPRVAALGTTFLILLVVLLPVFAVISVAASQFTAMVNHVRHFDDLSAALDRVREQASLTLEHPNQFRRLNELAIFFGGTQVSDSDENELVDPINSDPELLLAQIQEASVLLDFLQKEVEGAPTAEPLAEEAREKLAKFGDAVRERMNPPAEKDQINVINAEEQFHSHSLAASDAIQSWMRTFLGGTIRSQALLLANPSEAKLAQIIRNGRETLQPTFVHITSATGKLLLQTVVSLIILVISVYFFLLDGPAMIQTVMRLSPMDDDYERRLLLEFDRTSRAVVLASVLSAIVQGFLAAIAFWFFGFNSVILLFLLTTMMALIPFLGAASVWVPCAIWLGAVEQRWAAAIILAIYGATLVSSIDNVIKMYVLHGRSTLHPLFALLSVFGGVTVFGPIGVLIGPMVVVFLQTLLEILNHELVSTETDEAHAEKAQEIAEAN